MMISRLTLADVQAYARFVNEKLEDLLNRNIDLNGRRIMNAGKAVADFDYVRKFELDQVLASTAPEVESARPRALLNTAETIRYGAFSTRGAAVAHDNELFFASDLDYMAWISAAGSWIYAFGVRRVAQSGISGFTANLGTNDAGALINVSDFTHLLRWTGSGLEFAPGDSGSGYIAFFPITPPGGTWGICDGTQYSYLKADGTTANFTTPNYGTAVYIKGGTTASIGPNAASGTTANESAHTHQIDPPSTASGNNSASATVQSGSGATVAADPHTHTTDIAAFTSGAGSAHNHGPGTLELANSQLVGYFRR